MKRNEVLLIEDILENILLIKSSVKDLSKAEFISNKLIIDATVRRLEVIGEAAKNVSEKIRVKYPEVKWKKITGTRDIIIHAYFSMDLDIVWEIIKKDLPILEKQIKRIKEELEK